jgi:phospholipid transport system substrate-binding protein
MTYLKAAVLALAVFVAPLATATTQDSGPIAVVERFQAALLSVMRDAAKLGYQGRYDRLAPAVKESHDLPLIARIALGRYWDQLSDEQRQSFVDTFSKLSIATYAGQFDSYGGETFKTLSEEQPSANEAVVHSLFVGAKGDQRRFDYQLRRSDDRWLIINIIVDGVSDLALKRADYTSVLSREGFGVLIAKLQEKIVQYAKAN